MIRLANAWKVVTTFSSTSKMAAFTLYGARGSTNTDRVRLTLAEGGFTDFDFVLLNLQKGEQKVSQFIYLASSAVKLTLRHRVQRQS